MKKKEIFKILIRFGLLTLILFAFIGIAIPLIYNPVSHYIYSDTDWDDFSFTPQYNHSEWNILLDPHSHTYYSDGDLSPRQNLKWHIAMGFNAMVLTDHNTFEGVEEIRNIARTEFNDTIKVLFGMEWTTDRIHMNVILPPNITKEECETLITFNSYAYTPTDEEIQEIISLTHNLGGVIIVNHIPWSMRYTTNHPTRDQLYNWGIDYIEVINEDVFDNESYYYCLDNGLGMLAGTDMHIPQAVYAWTKLNSTSFTEEAIFAELKARRTGLIFDGIPSPYPINHEINPGYIALLPIIKFGDFFESMYSSGMLGTQLGVFFAYVYGLFFLAEGIKALIRFIRKKSKKFKSEAGSEKS